MRMGSESRSESTYINNYMRTFTRLLSLLAVGVVSLSASAADYLTVVQKNGDALSFKLSDTPTVVCDGQSATISAADAGSEGTASYSYDGGGIVVNTASGSLSFADGDVRKIYFTDKPTPTAIGRVDAEADAPTVVYALDGSVVATYAAGRAIDVQTLPKGVLIVRTGTRAMKIVNK